MTKEHERSKGLTRAGGPGVASAKKMVNANYCSRVWLPTNLKYIHQIATQKGEEISVIDEFDEFILC